MKVASFPGTWCFRTGLTLVLGIVGCGGKDLHQVKGKVVYEDGSDISVLIGGLITFYPVDAEGTPVSARGEIQLDGSFRMSTYKEGDGVVSGKRFLDFETSGLEITVNEAVNDYTIKVRKP